MRILLRLAVPLVFIFGNGFSQTILDQPLLIVQRQPLVTFLSQIEKQYPVKFYYLEEWLAIYQVDESLDGYTLKTMLHELLAGSDINYSFHFGYALIFAKDPSRAIQRESIINKAIIQRKSIEQKVIGDKKNYQPGQTLTLKGVVRDQDSKHILSEATVILNNEDATTTDSEGGYELHLVPGEHVITFHFNGYDDKVVDLSMYDHGVIDISLQETPIMLEEVVISDQKLLENTIGQSDLSMLQIKRLPTFLGEVDVIKQIQSQPGVTTVGEVASGFNVRGGSADQNLVLFDDVPIFNTSHALGFFTAFNPDAISDVQFYRGGIHAQYGGRVSSVLNIVSGQGDYRKWNASGGIGLISSHVTAGGPIRRETTSALLSVRSSYSDWMLKSIPSNYQDVKNSSAMFYDGSLKLSHKINNRSKLTLSGYTSHDRFSLADDTTYYWRNIGSSFRYDLSVSDRLFSSLSLTYGMYEYKLREHDLNTAFDLRYSIVYPALKADFQLEGRHKIGFGIHNTLYEFHPGRLQPASETSSAKTIKVPSETSLESALYFSDGFDITEKMFLELGLRYSLFNRLGPATVFHYRSNAPREVRNIIDSVSYTRGEISATYDTPEPRVFLRYQLNELTSAKIGYNRMAQYLHQITNSAAITPTDIWQSGNAYFKPQVADQISAGVFRNIFDGMFETFVEAYFKKVRNVLDFKDGADLLLNKYLETDLIATSATSYGIEVSATKVKARLIGSFSYTLSRSWRQTQTDFISDQINNGEKYPSNYDQPHVVKLNWRYGLSRRLFFSGNFMLHTGRPVSLPRTLYSVDGVPVSGFSERNQYRIPDYHRLDLAFIVEGNHKRKKTMDGNWVFSFYNVYARKNAYSVFFTDDGTGYLKPYRLTVIGTVIPSISYSFKL